MAQPQLFEMLRTLYRHQVDFILIGGVSGVLHGAGVTTYDLDIVQSREPENLVRLLEALEEIEGYYRTHPRNRILPDVERLALPGHHLLMTNFGPLDILGTVTKGRDYHSLLPDTIEMSLPGGGAIRVISLEMLIVLKRETAREKDKLMLPILIHTLNERNRVEEKDLEK